ncbi:MAG: novN [Acidimicrobiales bacterium]|nr:novN [Acidimicrobiales bacterium]
MKGRTGGGPILGLSFDYHDAAAALVVDGTVVAAAEEERFTRLKHDPALPVHALAWCLEHAGVEPGDLGGVAFYDKPLTKYERILVTHAQAGPRGFPSLARAVGQWSKTKLWVAYRIERTLRDLGHPMPPLTFAEHHQSHAAAAFYPSPYDRAAILTFDGLGEWATSSIAWGSGHRIEVREELRFPDSLGLLYSAMTAFCGFAVNDGEYKLMGLAPYGEPRYADVLRDRVVSVADDGSIRLDQRWFDYRSGRAMTRPRLGELLDGPARTADQPLGQREADIARSVQEIIEESVLKMARHAHELTGERVACLAGGVALNCVANSRLLDEGPFDELWVQPAAGDDGSAIGAALWAWHQILDHPRPAPLGDGMSGTFLGPGYDQADIASWLADAGVPHDVVPDEGALCELVGAELAGGAIVGWFQGRMEFGPRALGHRSILADPRDPAMSGRLNQAVKRREGFRPFAPAVLSESCREWFDCGDSPYMLFTAQVTANQLVGDGSDEAREDGMDEPFAARLARRRSTVPACTHVDGSARVQTVDQLGDPLFHALLSSFARRTGCPVLVNTSFNRRDEPIVRTPADALACFVDTDLDLLVLERCVVRKADLAAGILAGAGAGAEAEAAS